MIQHSVMLLAQRHEIALAAAAAMMAMTMTVTMARSIAIAIAMRYPRVAVEAVASELHDEDNRSTTTNTTLTPRSTSFSSLLSDGRESGEQPQRASSRSRRKAAGEQQRIMLPQVPRNSHIESQSPIANRVACDQGRSCRAGIGTTHASREPLTLFLLLSFKPPAVHNLSHMHIVFPVYAFMSSFSSMCESVS